MKCKFANACNKLLLRQWLFICNKNYYWTAPITKSLSKSPKRFSKCRPKPFYFVNYMTKTFVFFLQVITYMKSYWNNYSPQARWLSWIKTLTSSRFLFTNNHLAFVISTTKLLAGTDISILVPIPIHRYGYPCITIPVIFISLMIPELFILQTLNDSLEHWVKLYEYLYT
jgi:hypothetical protein